jgi:hypothetical protein
MPKELFNQPLISSPDEPQDLDRVAFGQPSVAGGKNILWSRFKEILQDIITTFTSIKLDPENPPVTTQQGEFYWNGKFYTINYDTGLGATVTIGNTEYTVFYNDTGGELPPGKNMHLLAGFVFEGQLYPTFELADPRDWSKVQGTLGMTMHTVGIGALGLLSDRAQLIEGVDTSGVAAGAQLWIKPDGTGDITDIHPQFPDIAISVGGSYDSQAEGSVFYNVTTDINEQFSDAWDGSCLETFNFTTSSNGTIVTGLLENVEPTRDVVVKFSTGRFTVDTTTSPLTIALTPGTDNGEQTNYIYIPESTKVLTVSTSGWPTTEHARIAQVDIQSAITTQDDGGALGNQNTNDHLKYTNDNGHILHISSWIRKQFATWESGTEATFDNTGGNGYVQITGGIVNQMHEQSVDAFSMVGGDNIRAWNDFSGNRPKYTNLTSITAYSDGSPWNNEWGKIVVWRVANKSGEYSPVMFNLPSGGYNSEANAIEDLQQKANFAIPNNFKTKAILVAAFTFRISGGVITYNIGYEDLRGQVPITVAGGGGGGAGGVTTYLALTDTPNSRVGKAGNVPVVNAGETADEYEPKSWLWNAARTFYSSIVSLATANRVVKLPDKDGTIAFLDDTPLINATFDTGTADADPGAGNFRYNNATQSAATQININEETGLNAAITIEILDSLKNGATAKLECLTDINKYAVVKLSADAINASTFTKLPLDVVSKGFDFEAGDQVAFVLLNAAGDDTKPILVDPFNSSLSFDSKDKYMDDYIQSAPINFTLADVSFGYGSTIYMNIQANGNDWTFPPEVDFLNNDYNNLPGNFDIYLLLVNNGRVRANIINTGVALALATLTSDSVSGIESLTAIGNGAITDLGGGSADAHGVVWNTTGSPTISDNISDLGIKSTTGPFQAPITGLIDGTHYYVRSFATNDVGTSYGDEVEFVGSVLSRLTFSLDNLADNTLSIVGSDTVYSAGDSPSFYSPSLARELLSSDGGGYFEVVVTNKQALFMARTENENLDYLLGSRLWVGVLSGGTYYRGGSSGDASTGVSAVIGDLVGIFRVGTNVKARYNRGAGWIDLYDFGNASVLAGGNIYMQIAPQDLTGLLQNPTYE